MARMISGKQPAHSQAYDLSIGLEIQKPKMAIKNEGRTGMTYRSILLAPSSGSGRRCRVVHVVQVRSGENRVNMGMGDND